MPRRQLRITFTAGAITGNMVGMRPRRLRALPLAWLPFPLRGLLPRHKKSLYLPDPGALAVITLTANDCTVSA
jgi:hypothetical protein